MAAMVYNDYRDETEMRRYLVDSLKHITLDIANRLQRELNAEFGGDLFLAYTPDLTVGKARGHIILMEDSHKASCSLENPQCTYVFGWPDNKCGYATIAPFQQRSAAGKNLYVQSIYEMKLSDDDLITSKKEGAKKVASEVTSRNYKGEGILGFNAMNANGGLTGLYDLDTYEFAHIFNGFAFDMFVENMKNATVGKDRLYGGIVSLDHFGAGSYVSYYRPFPVNVYGDYLRWAVIESNFYKR